VEIEGGVLRRHEPVGTPVGTTIKVEDLFFNTPARYKFLKKDTTEAARIADMVEKLIIARPDVSFRLLNQEKQVLHSPGNNDLLSALYSVYGKKSTGDLLPLQSAPQATPGLSLSGYIGLPEAARKTRARQLFYVNGRIIQSPMLTTALEEGYKPLLMKGQFPFAVIQLNVPTQAVDINVHPQKSEVRFANEREIFSLVYHSVQTTLAEHRAPRTVELPEVKAAEQAQQPTGEPMRLADLVVREEPPAELPPVAAVTPAVRLPDPSPVPPLPVQTERTAEPVSTAPAAPQEAGPPAAESNEHPMTPLLNGKIAGRLFNTYILIEADSDAFYLIDQHAAHEKIHYEALLERYQHQEAPVQLLLVPVTMDVTASERQTAEAARALLERFGFEFESFGENSLVIRAYPLSLEQISPSLALRNALDEMAKLEITDAVAPNQDEIHHILATIACKASVRAHDPLSDEEIRSLLEQMSRVHNPYQCPHGRPAIIRIHRYDLEKLFKRVV
jgi:DNA mismatch repair protein MutL